MSEGGAVDTLILNLRAAAEANVQQKLQKDEADDECTTDADECTDIECAECTEYTIRIVVEKVTPPKANGRKSGVSAE